MALLLNMSCPCFFSHLLFVFFVYALVPFSSCQSNSQNIETFYPFPVPSPSPAPSPANSNKPNSSFLPPGKSPSPQPSALPLPEPRSSSSTTVAKAVAATAVSTFVVATLLFFFIQRYVVARRRTKRVDAISGGGKPPPPVLDYDKFSQVDGSLKGVIVDENGLDMLYWRKLEEENKNESFQKEDTEEDDDDGETAQARNGRRKNSQPIQEIPLLRGKSSVSQDNKVGPEIGSPDRFMAPSINPQSEMVVKAIEKSNLTSQTSNLSHLLPSPSAAPPLPPLPPPPAMAIPAKQAPATPPPPPIPAKQNAPPPPPPTPPIPAKKNNATPPPPPIPAKKNNSTPPPPPIPAKKSTTPPHLRHPRQLVLLRLQKYLRWLKGCQIRVNQGSLQLEKAGQETGMARFDDDLMEALFGSVATNRRSPNDGVISDPKNQKGSLPAQIAILDVRKSQNIAIVLKSLGISREEILDSLTDGQGLNAETLEKLMRIAPTKEEEFQILEFDGDLSRLAYAEFFLYNLLKAVPSAFTRLDAMLFRLNYDSEILQFKESLQTLELGCKELRNRGLFIKLLEAILKAGNRLNAGTSRGNAQAFNLTSLRKLSDVKSTNGKTTLLQFIVEELMQHQGRKGRRNIMLGLPMVGGLSSEFSNVKKAAQIDYEAFAGTCSALTARIAEVRMTTSQCADNGEGAFAREMKGFIEAAEEELKVL
ncbi:hypothetical protein GH714_027237 [Hevea brasiliensis]|uniref:Formin-like protein n=1 Tax=Hevea brasiliensis TaxID=3981 RepID=A0A6A6NJK6_HEVBR|nr:hypothetical protein GH714_027237 [Hevea brasiliensis]